MADESGGSRDSAHPSRDVEAEPRAPVAASGAASGAASILVLGTTNDPATSYEWAVAVASQLESGILVTRQGEGHTAFNKGNDCVNATVEQYLIDGVVPTADVMC